MIVLMKHTGKLLSLLVLLNIVQECLVTDDDPSSNDVTPASDPNAIRANEPNSAVSPKPGRFSSIKGKFPNREKWRQYKEKLLDVFRIKPAEQYGTLKEAKAALVTIQMLMDRKVFDSCTNPVSYRINHFDVRNHIFTKEYIKMNPYEEKFMNIYDKFLNECCHPLFDMYEQRLSEDQAESNKTGNRMYKVEKIPDQERPELEVVEETPSQESSEPVNEVVEPSKSSDHQIHSPKERKVTFASPPGTEETSQPIDTSSTQQPPVNNRKQWVSKSAKAARHYSSKAAWITLKLPVLPFSYGSKGVKAVGGGVNNQLVRRKWKKGPFQAQALTYWQKAFIYRALNWATSFLIEPRYIPSIKLKRKLDEIVDKYGMNLLDPRHGNLRSSIDCIPVKPTDLENCCEYEDKSIEHFYRLSDVHIEQKKKEKLEKQERKRLGLKKEKKKKKISKKLGKTAKFRLKMINDLNEYGFYPPEPNKQVARGVINAFLSGKFKEIFLMEPEMAKQIIKKRYNLRKYEERGKQLGLNMTVYKEESNAALDWEYRKKAPDTNPYFNSKPSNSDGVGKVQHASDPNLVQDTSQVPPPADGHPVKQKNTESWLEKHVTKNFYVAFNALKGACFGGVGSNKKQSSTSASEHLEDGHVQSPNSHQSSPNTSD